MNLHFGKRFTSLKAKFESRLKKEREMNDQERFEMTEKSYGNQL